MHRFVVVLVFAVAVLCLRAGTAEAQQKYAAVLLQYLTGDADAALREMRTLDKEEIHAGLDAFNTTRSPLILAGAAAMHTEAALRVRTFGSMDLFQLQIATAIVEAGESGRLKSNSRFAIAPQHTAPVSKDFRRLWYVSVITVLEDMAGVRLLDGYLARALEMYPRDPEVQLLAGIHQELLGAPRTSVYNARARRHANEEAEKHYRAVLAAAPDRQEARLRLGRLRLQQRDLAEARALLTPLVSADDIRMSYLAGLFLGGVEDASGHLESAAALYEKAATLVPNGQAARLAVSELHHRQGEREVAAQLIPPATGETNTFDPWWTYLFGEYWRSDLLLDAVRGARRS